MTELLQIRLVLLVGIIAAIGGVWIVAATVGIVYCRRHKKGMHNIIFSAIFYTIANVP